MQSGTHQYLCVFSVIDLCSTWAATDQVSHAMKPAAVQIYIFFILVNSYHTPHIPHHRPREFKRDSSLTNRPSNTRIGTGFEKAMNIWKDLWPLSADACITSTLRRGTMRHRPRPTRLLEEHIRRRRRGRGGVEGRDGWIVGQRHQEQRDGRGSLASHHERWELRRTLQDEAFGQFAR